MELVLGSTAFVVIALATLSGLLHMLLVGGWWLPVNSGLSSGEEGWLLHSSWYCKFAFGKKNSASNKFLVRSGLKVILNFKLLFFSPCSYGVLKLAGGC